MDDYRKLTRAALLWSVMLLALSSSGCSYFGIKHRVLGLAGYGCPTCGADAAADCACAFKAPSAGYQSTLWGKLEADCWPQPKCPYPSLHETEEKPAESVLPEEATTDDEVSPLPEPLDLDPAPAPPGRVPGVTPEGQREGDPAPPLFDPDQSSPNPFPLRDGKGGAIPPAEPDLFDETDTTKPKEKTESPNPFPLQPKGNQLKEEPLDLFQQKSSPTGPEEGNVVKFGRVLHAAPPATTRPGTQTGTAPDDLQSTNLQKEVVGQEESRTTLRLGPVLSR